jgi:hypothetical protein
MAYRWAPDYRDENRSSRYPFADGSTLVADTGLVLDPALFLDASIYPIGAPAFCALTVIEVSNRLIVIWVGDPDEPRRASCAFDPLAVPSELRLSDPYGRPAGLLLADQAALAGGQSWDVGTHVFPSGSADFAVSCVIPSPEVGVRGFITGDGDLLTGDVWWVGEHGVVVRADGKRTIRIDVVGDPLFVRRLCFPRGLFSTPRFIRTINGIPPGPDGDFRILVDSMTVPDTVLRIYPLSATELAFEVVGAALEGA